MNGFSKVYERYLLNSLSNHIEKILSNFMAWYRKTYSSSHVLIRLIENWKKHLDNKKIVGTVLMDLSKTFDCIPHDLLIAKLHPYGFKEKALTFLYSYLKRRKQRFKMNDTESFFSNPFISTMVCKIFKTLNNLNPVFMKDIFHYSPNVTYKNHNLYIHTQNTTKFGNKCSRLLV